ncbi:DUF3794 domain-containing protein [Clostridium uliginosum]|uniref:SipL SPOCS domain-containing protein n=1 Tax=Clostridium uliginosum TaxID=119641 RepID=A0A1I1L075_9CLOT|nr:DUF3794 domain-containing protein [Clostridium uliginosum]SFC66434.1 protein of unknown function [Clostridium uliginosum]
MKCNDGCNKESSCSCGCTEEVPQQHCDDCINEESIEFSGICDPSEFEVNTKFWTDISTIGTVAVPKEKPSIEEIDKIGVTVEILKKKTIVTPKGPDGLITNYEGKSSTGKKLVVEGLICLSISYVSLTKEQRVHSFHGQIPFSTFIVLPASVCLDYDYLISNCVQEVCVKRVCDRTIDFCVDLLLKATPIVTDCNKNLLDESGLECTSTTGFKSCSKKDCFTDNPDIKGICDSEKLIQLLQDKGKEWTEISVPELLTIPKLKPDIYQILSVNSRVEIMCQKVIATPDTTVTNYEGLTLTGFKLLVHALLRQRITYISTSECGSVHSAHYDMPISAYIVLDGDTTNFTDKFKIKACIEDVFACPLNERQIFKNTTLFIKAEPIEVCSII